MIRLPEEFKEIEKAVNTEIKRLEKLIENSTKIIKVGSDQRVPPNRDELRLGIYRDPSSTTKKIVLRDEGKNYTINLTEVT